MPESDPEQERLQRALRDHSDQFLETLDEVGSLEATDRTMPIGSPDFARTARDVRLAADKLQQISEAQESIGDQTVRTDVTIDDVPKPERARSASARPTRDQPALEEDQP